MSTIRAIANRKHSFVSKTLKEDRQVQTTTLTETLYDNKVSLIGDTLEISFSSRQLVKIFPSQRSPVLPKIKINQLKEEESNNRSLKVHNSRKSSNVSIIKGRRFLGQKIQAGKYYGRDKFTRDIFNDQNRSQESPLKNKDLRKVIDLQEQENLKRNKLAEIVSKWTTENEKGKLKRAEEHGMCKMLESFFKKSPEKSVKLIDFKLKKHNSKPYFAGVFKKGQEKLFKRESPRKETSNIAKQTKALFFVK